MPYIPAKYIPPASGAIRSEPSKPKGVQDPSMKGPPVGLTKAYANPSTNPVSVPTGYRDFVPKSRSPAPSFYIGANKRAISADGISEEDRKSFGMEKLVDIVKVEKGFIGLLERGINVTSIGINLKSDE
jgi:hypothetical protein